MSENDGYMKKDEIGERCFIFRETTTFTDDIQPIQDLFLNDIVAHVMFQRKQNELRSKSDSLPASTQK